MFRGGGSDAGCLYLERYPFTLDILVVSLVGAILSKLLYAIALTIISVGCPLLFILPRLVRASASPAPRLLNACVLGVSLLLVVIVLYLYKALFEEPNVV